MICSYWAILQRRHRLHSRWQQLEIEAARSKAERGTRAKSQFLANMSHEIRTPMNGVLGMTDVLLSESLTAHQRDCAKAIQSSGENLLSLLDGILDISKIEVGRIELDPVEFSPRDLLESIGTLLEPTATAKGVEFAVRLEPRMPARVVGDATRLRQVLLNLAGNALKFTHRGHVLLEAELVSPGRLRFRISDTGIGIPEEKQATVFDRFSQADESTTRRYGGTGLGLSISQELVTLMGGRIKVRSVVDEGASFEFELSLAAIVAEGEFAPLTGARVLLAHERPVMRGVLAELIASWGAKVVFSAEERHSAAVITVNALETLHTDVPRVLLCGVKDVPQEGGPHCVRGFPLASELRSALCAVLANGVNGEQESVGRHAPVFADLRVLVAEDNEVNQRVAMMLLKRLGCLVDVASNGVQAVEMWRLTAYDIVFMDCQMPELDGYAATAEIRRSERGTGRHTPIVALTANAMIGDRERCLEAGMDGHLAKPVSLDRIEAALHGLMTAASL